MRIERLNYWNFQVVLNWFCSVGQNWATLQGAGAGFLTLQNAIKNITACACCMRLAAIISSKKGNYSAQSLDAL
jgi:hypothetical protein